jgi:hypothetical protein
VGLVADTDRGLTTFLERNIFLAWNRGTRFQLPTSGLDGT